MKEIKIAPSILSADFARLGEQVKEVEKAGADMLHIDVMDGHFVQNITIGPLVVKAIKKETNLPLDVHLMIERPDRYIDSFIDAGASFLTVHAEASKNLARILSAISKKGASPGVSIKPSTPLDAIRRVLADVDLVLIMTVNPGFGGQKFIESTIPKIRKLRTIIDTEKLKAEISVDGGINKITAKKAAQAGVDILVAGYAVYKSRNIKKAIQDLRKAAEF